MIIQCKQCKTKFRFEDSQMEGDGLWMRCSRCHHVFFQDNPVKAKPLMDLYSEVSDTRMPDRADEQAVKPPSFEPDVRRTAEGTQDEDMKAFMREVIGDEKVPDAEIPAVSKPKKQDDVRGARIDFDEVAQIPDEMEAAETETAEEETIEKPRRKKGGAWKLVLWALLVIIIIPALAYVFIFPDVGERYIQIVHKYIGGSSQPTDGQVVMGQIKLQDIRQRIVSNVILGNIRIVEGTAVNQADFPVSRIRVKSEILDAYAVVMGERVSYAGNILTEEELANMSEDEIQKRLAQPEGRNNINEKVLPNGRIPFMIIFTREPAGVIKTTVMVIGAERLL